MSTTETTPRTMSTTEATPGLDRRIKVLSSGQRARSEIDIAGQTRKTEHAPPERSFSYTQY